jgi:hypothetical protein
MRLAGVAQTFRSAVGTNLNLEADLKVRTTPATFGNAPIL